MAEEGRILGISHFGIGSICVDLGNSELHGVGSRIERPILFLELIMLHSLRKGEPIILHPGVLLKHDMGTCINFSLHWGHLVSGLSGPLASGLVLFLGSCLRNMT